MGGEKTYAYAWLTDRWPRLELTDALAFLFFSFLFGRGRIIEKGSFQELMKLKGKFWDMWEKQQGGEEGARGTGVAADQPTWN